MLTYRSFLIVMLLASVFGAGSAMFADTPGEAVWFARVGSGGVFFALLILDYFLEKQGYDRKPIFHIPLKRKH
jgi:hypothetical protein